MAILAQPLAKNCNIFGCDIANALSNCNFLAIQGPNACPSPFCLKLVKNSIWLVGSFGSSEPVKSCQFCQQPGHGKHNLFSCIDALPPTKAMMANPMPPLGPPCPN